MSALSAEALASQSSLGDPAGNCNAAYWDSWFTTVSSGTAFEWYASSADVLSLLSSLDLLSSPPPLILHAGTGNSDLVAALASPPHGQTEAVAIDISPVAIEEMNSKAPLPSLTFRVQDVLQPCPAEDESRFDAVLDKGLFDAMMGDASASTAENCRVLFANMHFALKPGGRYVCVSLAEDHVVELLLGTLSSGLGHWGSLDVHEITPSSSTSSLRPFAFVLTKSPAPPSYSFAASPFAPPELPGLLSASRATFAALQKSRSPPPPRMSLVTLFIKPYEAEFDLLAFGAQLKGPVGGQFSHVTWRTARTVPVGYGISKLEMELVMKEEDVDDLLEFVVDSFEDDIQSCDLDSAVPVASTGDLLGSALMKS